MNIEHEEDLDDYILIQAGTGTRQGEFIGSFEYVAEAIKAADDLDKWYIITKDTIKTIVSHEDKL